MSEGEMSTTEQRLREEKQAKLERLGELGIDAYPWRYEVNSSVEDCLANEQEWMKSERVVSIAGRLMSKRVMGKTAFGHLQDRSGSLQLFLRQDEIGKDDYKPFVKLVEAGDLLGAKGVLFRTKTGELSLRVAEMTLLSKAMQPMPEKYHGLQDQETRYRRRYLDLAVNPEVREVFELRARVISKTREFFDSRRFLEVETPILQPLYGGATARPFTTHHNAQDMGLYLRISDELYLKRLIVGGLERVYELGKVFRNEGMDRSHNPEFTMLEAYCAYWDYNDMMDLVEEFYPWLAKEVLGTTRLTYGDTEIELAGPWRRLTYFEAIEEYTGRDLAAADRDEIAAFAEQLGIETEDSWGGGKILDEICGKKVEPHLIEPCFLMDHPREISPLAKQHRDNPALVERFEPFIAGFEVANAFSELNDPAEQRQRFEGQMGLRAKGDDEAQVLDEDYIRALELGMPPTAGLGIGIDRLVMLLSDTQHIRDVLLFPLMKAED